VLDSPGLGVSLGFSGDSTRWPGAQRIADTEIEAKSRSLSVDATL
jgi:hypothetical protein